jgi:hypothetical protein
MMASDQFDRGWITANAIEICAGYAPGVLTLRGLHYQLVGRGMTNSIQHYKRVVGAMIQARREGLVQYRQFSDHDREMIGRTDADPTTLEEEIETGKAQVKAWMEAYGRNRWENQPRYVEVWIEKKALQGVFASICRSRRVALCPCKGYPSLTFLYEASKRFKDAASRGQQPTMVYFGDSDPSGEDIPRSIGQNLEADFGVCVDVQVIALTTDQVEELNLPPAPVKLGDSRAAKFGGIGQVELDAVVPETLQEWAKNAIEDNFDTGLYDSLMEQEEEERGEYRAALREFVEEL